MTLRIALFATALCFAAAAASAPTAKLGYVDMQTVIEQSQLGQRAQAQLEEEFGPQRAEFAEEELAIRELQAKLERDKPLMSEEQIGKQETELKERIKGYREKAAATQEQLLKEQQKMSQEIVAPALEAVEAIAKQRNLSAVFERSRSGLVYVDDGIDLTPAVIERLDAETK